MRKIRSLVAEHQHSCISGRVAYSRIHVLLTLEIVPGSIKPVKRAVNHVTV